MNSKVYALILSLCVVVLAPFVAGAQEETAPIQSEATTVVVETTQNPVDLSSCEITVNDQNLIYNTKAQTPKVIVKSNNVTFTNNVDYKLTYQNNVKAGTATVVITAIKNNNGVLTGSCSKTFTIQKKDISVFATKTISKAEYIYSGKENKPILKFVGKTSKAVLNTDYTLSYKNNINAGTATVTATGIGNYTGTYSKTFKILKKDISVFATKTISKAEYVYSGKENKPILKFVGKTSKAVLNTDYKLTYKNNKNTGIATVTATGIGNYTGTYSKTFAIYPKKVTVLKNKKVKTTTFTLSWTKANGNVSGYRVYRLNPDNNEWVYAVFTKNNYFDVGAREPATTYTYMIKACTYSEGRTLLSEPSNKRVVVMRPVKTVLNSSAYQGKNFVFKWEKQKASGFEIRYSKNAGFKKGVKHKYVKSSKATSAKIKLSSKVHYYYQIRAYKLYDGKKYYGEWSEKSGTTFSNVYSKYSTTFSSPEGRTTNIKVACKYIDGMILQPGEIFSFNEVVGRRTPERGFKVATVYSGQEVLSGYGGGVCQVSTTIFNAVLYANLQIVERCQHSMTVHYVPYGRDAAISWGSADFKFKNTTNVPIKISAKVYDNYKLEIKLLTSTNIKPKKVSLNVSSSYYNGNMRSYYLTRKVNGQVNYSTSSTY